MIRFEEEVYNVLLNNTDLIILNVWMVTVLFTSLSGDSIILLATIKYRAIKQHKVVIAVMQHMAVCDLLQTIFRVLPTILVTCIGPDHLFSSYLGEKLFCHIQENMTWLTNTVTMMLTCALTMLKLVIVKYPLRTGSWSSRLGHKICTSVWLLFLGLYAPVFVMKMIHYSDVSFDEILLSCGFKFFQLPHWLTWYSIIINFLITVLSFLIVIVNSIILLVVAKKAADRHGDRLRWEGISTVLLTVGVLLVSQLPYLFLSYCIINFLPTGLVVCLSLTYLNIIANFFIYALTLRSFRAFLKLKIIQILSSVRPATIIGQRPNQRVSPNQRVAPKQRIAPILRAIPNVKATPAEEVLETSIIPSIQQEGPQTSKNTKPNIRDTSV